jgi:hypothetical protein
MNGRPARHPAIATLTLLAASAATLALVAHGRPHLSGGISSWRGDDLAFATTWLLALIGAAWLTLTTLACLAAMTAGERALAGRVAGWAPPMARRLLQTALIGGWALVPSYAYAATPAPPLTVHVSTSGRLSGIPSGTEPADVPVVRAPRAGAVHPEYGAASPAHTPTVPTPTPTPQPPSRTAAHVVAVGENLWQIAKAEVGRASGNARPDNRAVGAYWQQLVAANRATLRSGNPSLIFAGEVVTLPAATGR